MNKKNIYLTITVLLSIMLVLAACGGNNDSSSGNTESGSGISSEENNQTNDSVGENSYVLRLSHGYPPASLHHQNMLWFNEQLQERSNGRLSLEIYPGAQLMPIDQEIPNILQGQIDMTHHLTSITGNFDPIWYLFDLPFLFKVDPQNPEVYSEHRLTFMRSENGGGKIEERMEEKGLKVIAFSTTDVFAGPWMSNDKIVKVPEDLNGMKIRTAGGTVVPATISSVGANATAVSGAELPTALQQGVVDGAFLPPLYVYDNKLPMKTFTYIPLVNYFTPVIISFDKFNELPEDLQQVLIETGKDLEDYSYDLVNKRLNEVMDALQNELQVEIYYPTPEELSQWEGAVKPVWDQYVKDVPEAQELIDEALRLGEEVN